MKGESCQGRNKEYIYVFLGKEKIGKIEKLATHPKKKTENWLSHLKNFISNANNVYVHGTQMKAIKPSSALHEFTFFDYVQTFLSAKSTHFVFES